jgi:DNA-binding NarL/FixJ family response regulator
MKFLIVDDHAVVRQGLKQILAEEFEGATFGEAADGEEAIARMRQGEWDLVLLDITMPGRNGLDVLKELREINPQLRVLVLSVHSEDQYAVRVLRTGASGYLTKDTAPEELVGAVKKVLGGGRFVSLTLAEKLASELNEPKSRRPHELLSDREFQVMRMIATGKAAKEIGYDLSLSVKTVSTYRARILEKMDLKTNADIVRYAVQEGLVD